MTDETDHIDGNTCFRGAYEKDGDDEIYSNNNGNAPEARMPAGRYDPYYNMNHKKRGIALIFNHEKFDCTELEIRKGTNYDRTSLEKLLEDFLDFEVQAFQDLKWKDIKGHLNTVANCDHSNHDCLLIAVLTHGRDGGLYAKDEFYKSEELWKRFTANKCPSLAGKPKIFLIQACQGKECDPGITLKTGSSTQFDGFSLNFYTIPVEADFLTVFSSSKGYVSFRPKDGSVFIQTFCKEVEDKAANFDLIAILTFVKRRVAFDYESNKPSSPELDKKKQMPYSIDTFTRLLHFNDKKKKDQYDNTKDLTDLMSNKLNLKN